jgi:hypothetical protein
MDAALIQWIITGLLVPAAGVAFWLLNRRADRIEEFNETKRGEIWTAIDADRKALHAWQLDAGSRFAGSSAIGDLKRDMDRRLDRMEEKLDRVLGQKGGD